MVWYPALLLTTQRRSSNCATKMCVWFVYASRHYVAMADMRHFLAPCKTHNFGVFRQKGKVWVLVFLEQADHFETNFSRLDDFLFFKKKRFVYSNTIQGTLL